MTMFVTPPNDADLVVTVIEVDPASVHTDPPTGMAESSSLLESVLVIITGNPALGTPPCRVQLAVVSRRCPPVTAPQVIPAGLTLAVTLLPADGVLNRLGVTAVSVVLPVLVE